MRPRTPWARRVGWSAVLAVVAGLGCTGEYPVYPVRGTVTFEGKPLVGGGSIAFVPLGDRPGKTAGGEIAADGTYRLTTYKPGDGSMAGEFRVVIQQVVEKEPERSPDGKAPPKPARSVPAADRIPAVYGDFQNSPLRATVEAVGSNERDFDLKRP